MESDCLTESVTDESAHEYPISRRQLVKRAKEGLKRLKSKVGSKTVNPRVIKSKANAVVTYLAKVSHPNQNEHGNCVAPIGGENENLIPPMLLAGLISTASKSTKCV